MENSVNTNRREERTKIEKMMIPNADSKANESNIAVVVSTAIVIYIGLISHT